MFSVPSEADITRELDILLAPLSKQLRYPLPVPQQLSSTAANLDWVSASPLTTLEQTQKRLDESKSKKPGFNTDAAGDVQAQREGVTRALKQQALRDCAARVDGLQLWQERIEEGLVRGLDSERVLRHVLEGVSSMRAITKSVQDQSNSLSHNASVLMARKVRLVQVQEELQRTIQHFTHMEDICREAEDAMLTTASPRFPQLFQDLENEMQFLSRNAQFKSARAYATKLAIAQQKTASKLMNAIKATFTMALRETSDAKRALSSQPSARGLLTDGSVPAQQPPEGGTGMDASTGQVALSGGMGQPQQGPMVPEHLGLVDLTNPTESFAQTLQYLNDVFLDRLRGKASLRRMAELRSSISYTGAEAFGEEPLNSIEEDPMLLDVLSYYCETRVGLVGPLLKNWLTVWCKAEAQLQQTATPNALAIEGPAAAPAQADTGAGATSGVSSAALEKAANEAQGEASPSLEESQSLNATTNLSLTLSQSLSPLTGLASAVSAQTQLPQLAKHICTLLEITLHAERHVLDEVWLRADFANFIFPKLVSDIAEELYHAFRARLVRVDELEELAATVDHIQVVNLRQASDAGVVQELSRLWLRMIQDVQERMIFRTSVCLRRDVGRGHPTKQLVSQYTAVITAGVTPSDQGPPLISGVEYAVYLLNLLYPTLEFSVFSVFAEEAVKTSLQHTKELGKMLSSQTAIEPWNEAMSLSAQLMHCLYVRNELSRIDANITVVEKSLDFAKLAKNRKFEIAQSSRESKKVVESEVQTCATRLSQCLCEVVAKPMTGARRMPVAVVGEKVKEMEALASKAKYLLFYFIQPHHPQTQEALASAVDRRVSELTHEVAEMHLEQAEVTAASAPAPAVPTKEDDTV